MARKPTLLPALRGHFGDWVYYASLMPVKELGARVQYAAEIHESKALSDLIQRVLDEGKRSIQIAKYLSTTERFFNSLVLAVYGGSPKWLEIGNLRAKDEGVLELIPETAGDSVGFLELSGTEKIFALDGQHRLAGIRRAIRDGQTLEDEQVPVILVGHKRDAAGLIRTRRLFTVLNKTAVPVVKRDIIALDEDDVMAIVTRRLVETNPAFKAPKIAIIAGQAMPKTNQTALATISSLYDVLKLLFVSDRRSARGLRYNRPTDARLDQYYAAAVGYFEALGETYKPVGDLFSADDPHSVTVKHRGAFGGHLLFRGIGLDLFTRTAVAVAERRNLSIPEAVRRMRTMPMDLTKPPYRGVLWEPARSVILTKEKTLARDLMFYMARLEEADNSLLRSYRIALGVRPTTASIQLPARINAV